MTNSYTYTARNADNPELVVTFTLVDDHLRLSMPAMFEMIGQLSGADEKLKEAKAHLKTQIKPGLVKAVEAISGPTHIKDASVQVADERFRLKIWQRLAGLRLAPFWLNMGRVDNPEAAQAFDSELKARQADAARPGRFFGPLDYWLGWVGLGLLLAILVRRAYNRNKWRA